MGGLKAALSAREAELAKQQALVVREASELRETWAVQERAELLRSKQQAQVAQELAKLRRSEQLETSEALSELRERLKELAERLDTTCHVVRNELGRSSEMAGLATEVNALSEKMEEEVEKLKGLTKEQVEQATEKQLAVMGEHLRCCASIEIM